MTTNYIVCGERLTEEEYAEQYGKPPSRLNTFSDGKVFRNPEYQEFYEGTLRERVTSFRDYDRKVKRFNKMQKELPPHLRDRAHPDGFSFVNDNHKFMREARYNSKHGKELREHQRKNSNSNNRRDTVYSFSK